MSKTQSPSTEAEIAEMSRLPYASAVGSIMYAMTCTRPDVAFALSMVSRYQANPGKEHWTTVKNILKYLRRTKDWVLTFGGSDDLRAVGYSDASFQTDRDNFCDNNSAVVLAKEPRDHGRSRHIDRKYHFIRHRIEEGLLVAKRVSSDENLADPLTKGLSRVKHL